MLPRAVSFFVGRGEAIVSPGSGSSSAPGISTWRFGSASWSVAASNAAVRTSRGFRPTTCHSFASLTASVLRRPAGHRRCTRASSRRRLAEEVRLREIDELVAAAAENGLGHEDAEAGYLLQADRGRHGELLPVP